MLMGFEEIVREYRTAKKPREQIAILADLNGVGIKDIIRILYDAGALNKGQVGQYRRRGLLDSEIPEEFPEPERVSEEPESLEPEGVSEIPEEFPEKPGNPVSETLSEFPETEPIGKIRGERAKEAIEDMLDDLAYYQDRADELRKCLAEIREKIGKAMRMEEGGD